MRIMDKLLTLKEQYMRLPKPARASFWFMVMSVIQKGIQFFVTPLYTRMLSTEEYGYYSLFASWSSIFMIVGTLNLAAGVFNNGMLKYGEDRQRYISSMQGLGNAVTVAVFAVIFVLRRQVAALTGLDEQILAGIFLLLMLNPAFSYWSQFQRYTYSYRALACTTVFMAALVPIVSLYFLYTLPDRKYAVIWGNVAVQAGIGAVFYLYNLKKGRSLFVKEYWKFAFMFNLPLIPHYLSSVVLGQADRIMINYYCGQDKVGIYSLTYTISLMLSIVTNAISVTFAPWTYQKMRDYDYTKIGKYSSYILLLLGGIVICGIMIAPELISFLGTSEYMKAEWIVAPVMMSCFFTMLYSLFANIEFYFEKTVYVMLASVAAASLNILLNAIFIPRFGFIAAGYTTMACYLALAVTHYIFMKIVCKEEGIKSIYNIRFIVLYSIALTGVSIVSMATYHWVAIRYGIIIGLLTVLMVYRKKVLEIFRLVIGKN